jgi:hypothetical protein
MTFIAVSLGLWSLTFYTCYISLNYSTHERTVSSQTFRPYQFPHVHTFAVPFFQFRIKSETKSARWGYVFVFKDKSPSRATIPGIFRLGPFGAHSVAGRPDHKVLAFVNLFWRLFETSVFSVFFSHSFEDSDGSVRTMLILSNIQGYGLLIF